MKIQVRASLLLVSLLTGAPYLAQAAPITPGTVFLDPDIITASDPTTFTGLSYAGMGNVLMFDRRINGFDFFDVFLFDATFSDGLAAQIQVNSEFGSAGAARIEALKYGSVIGQIPTALRTEMETVWIHRGLFPFGGGNNNLLIHTDQGEEYAAGRFIEEVFIHEGAHTSLDPTHAASAAWLAAQAADADFISTYAQDFPTQEDIAESFLPWLALRYRSDRIDPALGLAIAGVIPNRLAYFDAQDFDLFPVVPEPSTLLLLGSGIAIAVRRRSRRRVSRTNRALEATSQESHRAVFLK